MAEYISYIYRIIDKFSPALNKINAATRKFESNAKKTSAVVSKMGSRFTNLQTAAGGLAGAVGGKMALDKFTGFADSMNKLESVTLAGGNQMNQMREMAKKLGAETQFTASQAAEGMTYLAMAGLDTGKVLEAIPGTLQLAAAGGLELGQAADIATNVLGQMGMEVKDLAHVNDVLSMAQSKANFNIVELFEAMRPIGTTAANLGVDLEELTAYLGAMANAGEKGSIAGTLLRNAMTEVSTASDKQKKIYKALGVNLTEFTDKTGKLTNFKGLVNKLRELNDAGKLSVGVLQELYGERGFRAMQILSGKAGEGIAGLEEKLRKSGGTAQEMAAIRMKGLPGALKSMSSAFEAVTISIFESGLADLIKRISVNITVFARALSKMNAPMLKWIGIGGFFVTVFGGIAGALAIIIPVFSSVGGLIAGVFGMFAIHSPILMTLGTVVLPAIKVAFLGLLAPIAAFAFAFVGVGAAVYQIWKNWKYLTDDMKRFSKWWVDKFTFDSMVNGIEKVVEKIKPLIDSFYKLDEKLGFGSEKKKVAVTAKEADEKWAKVVKMRREAGLWKTPEKGVAATNAGTVKNNLNGQIVVAPAKGAQVNSASMTTDVPGNLGFNIAAGVTP